MMDAFEARIDHSIERFTQRPERLALVVAGAGLSLPFEWWRRPGCSLNLASADVLYSAESLARYLDGRDARVHPVTARLLAGAALARHPEAAVVLAITAAVTSHTRERRGGNKAAICLRWRPRKAGGMSGEESPEAAALPSPPSGGISSDAREPTPEAAGIPGAGHPSEPMLECWLDDAMLPRDLTRHECERRIVLASFTLLDTYMNLPSTRW